MDVHDGLNPPTQSGPTPSEPSIAEGSLMDFYDGLNPLTQSGPTPSAPSIAEGSL